MGERPTPALVHQAAEKQRKTEERRLISEQTPQVAQHVTDIIRATIPDPREDESKGAFYLNMTVDIVYSFKDGDQEVGVGVSSPRYPREEDPDRLPTFVVSVAGLGEWMYINAERGSMSKVGKDRNSVDFDEKDLQNLNDLLDGIDEGLKSGEIQPRIVHPRPERRSMLDLLLEDQYVAPLR